MKSLTIHGLDEQTYAIIKQQAKINGSSLNKTIKKLLQKSLGLMNKESDFDDLSGVWSEEDLQEFKDRQGSLRVIDPEDWQ